MMKVFPLYHLSLPIISNFDIQSSTFASFELINPAGSKYWLNSYELRSAARIGFAAAPRQCFFVVISPDKSGDDNQ
jgi:hypothetical protein